MTKIGLRQLKEMIKEELEILREGDDHDAAVRIMTSASKLLKAIDNFKENSSEKSRSEMGQHLEEIEKTLKRIVASPLHYVDATKPAPKKVTLKPQKEKLV